MLDRDVTTVAPLRSPEATAAPAPRRMPPSARIIRYIRGHTRRAPAPPAWAFLGSSTWIRQLRGEPAELESLLAARFPLAQLVAAGALVRAAGGKPALSPVLASTAFIIIRDPAGLPVDIVSSRGVMSSVTPRWLSLASTRHVKYPSLTEQVVLGWDDEDLAVLARLGFHVQSAAGLDALASGQLPLILDSAVHIRNHYPFRFSIAAWRVADLTAAPPAALAGTLTNLRRMEHRYTADLSSRFGVWLPNRMEVASFREALKLNDRSRLARELTGSVENSSITLTGGLAWLRDRERLDYAAARRRLRHAVERSGVVPLIGETAAALRQFRSAITRDFGTDFERRAASASSGASRLACRCGNELLAQYFETDPLVLAANRVLSGEHPRYSPSIDDGELSDRLKIVDRIAQLVRAVET